MKHQRVPFVSLLVMWVCATASRVHGNVCSSLSASINVNSRLFTDIVIFGASYVDDGWHNTNFVSGATLLASSDVNGLNAATGRNSNGPLFPEVLSSGDGLSPSSTYLSAVGPGGCTGLLFNATLHDFGYSGAACDPTVFGLAAPTAIPFSVKQQIAMQLTAGTLAALNQSSTLYIFLPATQDIADQGNTNVNTTLATLVSNCYLQSAMTLATQVGARNVLMGNMYPFDLAPQNAALTTTQKQNIATEVQLLNTAMTTIPSALRQAGGASANVKTYMFDMHSLYVNTLIPNAATYYGANGNVVAACSANAAATGACATAPDTYLWWDVHHPTRQTHKYIAQAMFSLVVTNGSSTGTPTTTPTASAAPTSTSPTTNSTVRPNHATSHYALGSFSSVAVMLFCALLSVIGCLHL